VTRQQLYNVIAGRSGITPEMSSRLEKGCGQHGRCLARHAGRLWPRPAAPKRVAAHL